MADQTGFGFNELHPEERGLLLGLSLHAAGDAALDRLAGERRQTCREAWQALRALSRSDRAALLARWMVEVQAPLTPGIERLHPSWLAQVIAGEPAELWPGLLCRLPGAQAVASLLSQLQQGRAVIWDAEDWPSESVAELQSCVFDRLASLAVGPAGPVGAGLCRLSCPELLAEVAVRGSALREQLCAEGEGSLCAVAGRLPAALGRKWMGW